MTPVGADRAAAWSSRKTPGPARSSHRSSADIFEEHWRGEVMAFTYQGLSATGQAPVPQSSYLPVKGP
jgi:hypothetical protein